ncbi:chaperone modulator CbpM [Marinomonas gallaica]|uniref:chaperone modulator CbpM n=1 Tax=Marinomonas gallaica TaxID=1806667 RepID=UPI0008333CDC|nr:chaperone modulator CbpM [Marinomonas gallaica]
MSKSEIVIIDSQHEHILFTLEEVCERCNVHTEMIIEMVEYGIVDPVEKSSLDIWYFNSQALMRLQRAQRLMDGLKLNLSGVAFSLELLDEIDGLQKHIVVLRNQLP